MPLHEHRGRELRAREARADRRLLGVFGPWIQVRSGGRGAHRKPGDRMRIAFLFAAAFLASAVEMVEALTIVLAVGITRGWRSTLIGVGAAAVVLAAFVGALGPALTLVPIDALRLVVGGLLLAFGLQWLKKAILRAAGYVALHDEAGIYEREREEAERAGRVERAGLDWYSFTISFKGV